jgi:protein-tyrosine phosphatase
MHKGIPRHAGELERGPMVDIHSHILPGVDDGAKSWEMAAEMCRVAAEDGIRHMVASPHANDEFSYDRARLEATLQKLRELIGGRVNLSLGCDFHVSFENLQGAFANPNQYLIGETNYLLIELSDFSFTPAILAAMRRFVFMGITPVVTHPERNRMMQRQPENVLELVRSGCIVQVTANSLTGFWGEGPRKMARWLLEHEAVHVIATDAHDLKYRPPILSEARNFVHKEYGADIAQALVELNPSAIVSDLPLAYRPGVR